MSLWKDGENVFAADRDDDPRGLGLSKAAYHFVGGLKAHAKAYIALTAPTVTSYKRLVVGGAQSGSTWAPVYISYGYNNRTQMLRIPAPGRIEDRTVDGSCNPYLAATAVLAAGLDGIENELDAGRADDRAQPARADRGRSATSSASSCCPATCSTPRASSSATTSCARRSATRAARTTSTTSCASSAASGRRRTSRSRSGSSTATCSCTERLTRARGPSLPWRPGGASMAIRAHPEAIAARRRRRGAARPRPARERHALRGHLRRRRRRPTSTRCSTGIVDLLTEATRCHACFVYLRDGERLRLRAASRDLRAPRRPRRVRRRRGRWPAGSRATAGRRSSATTR